MNSQRLTQRIVSYFVNKKTKRPWFIEVEKDLREVGITPEDIQERAPLQEKLRAHNRFQEKPKLKTGKKWTAERKEAHRMRMKEYWGRIKTQRCNRFIWK